MRAKGPGSGRSGFTIPDKTPLFRPRRARAHVAAEYREAGMEDGTVAMLTRGLRMDAREAALELGSSATKGEA